MLVQRINDRRENNDYNVEKSLVETILTEPDYNSGNHNNFNNNQQHSQQINGNAIQSHVRNVQMLDSKPLEHREIILEGFVVDHNQHLDLQNGVSRLSDPAKKRIYKHPEGFPCDMCPYRAKMKSHLRAHQQSVHEGIKYPCEHCDYKATAVGSLRRHYNAIHSGIKYRCGECEHVSNTPANLKYHHNTVHMGLRFPCNKCDYKATTISHLKKHKESVHEGIKYKCNECPHESTTKESLKVHKRSLHKKILFPCPKCDYVAKVSSHIKQHVRSVHDKIRFPCDQCEYSAINNSRLKHHKETVHSGLKFTCDEHSVPITTARQLKQIMREDVKFECRSCEMVARSSMHLLKRQKIVKIETDDHDEESYDGWGDGVEGVVEGVGSGMVAVPTANVKKESAKASKLQCDICYHEARNSAELKQHMMVMHEGTIFSCDHCSFKTSHSSSLKRHKMTVHPQVQDTSLHGLSDLKIYCDTCINTGAQMLPKIKTKQELVRLLEITSSENSRCQACKQVSSQSLQQLKFLESHIKVLPGEGPQGRFTCDVCGYDGRNFNDLKQHKLTVHEGVTYTCDLCDYVAARPEALKRHRKTRHEERKHLCDHCPFRAHTAVKLSQHKLHAHVGVRYPCNMCSYSTARPNKLKEHKLMFHNDNGDTGEVSCEECSKIFIDARSLKEHKQNEHDKVTPTFQCQHCGFNTPQVNVLQNHINNVHRKSVSVRQCGFCQYQCTHAGELQAHLNKVHSKRLALNQQAGSNITIATVSLGCEHCSFKCLTPQELQAHLQTIHNVSSPASVTHSVQQATNQAALQAAVNQAAAQVAADSHSTTAPQQHHSQSHSRSKEPPAPAEPAAPAKAPSNHDAERYPCDLSNHQNNRTQQNKPAESAKPKLFTINTQEYEQAALSGILNSPFRGQIPVGNMGVPGTFTTYSLHTPAGSIPTYQIVPGSTPSATPLSVPTFPASTTAPNHLLGGAQPANLAGAPPAPLAGNNHNNHAARTTSYQWPANW